MITEEARAGIVAHVEAMRARGHRVEQDALPASARHGTFVAPALIEISHIADVEREVFGPVLHVLRYRRDELDQIVDAINDTGYGLTFGLHTRIDETIARVTGRIKAGNIYVNRNTIGAVVGLQPFGGHGMSGTGPKAGGPLYLQRLVHAGSSLRLPGLGSTQSAPRPARDYVDWLRASGRKLAARRVQRYIDCSLLGEGEDLGGPVGEHNSYSRRGRGQVLVQTDTEFGLLVQVGAVLASGNKAVVQVGSIGAEALTALPASAAENIVRVVDWTNAGPFAAILYEGDAEKLRLLDQRAADLPGAIVAVHALTAAELAEGANYPLEWLVEEVAISTNTAAAGGNASLITIG